ncbi:MAG: hypothetical protein ACON38_17020 [Akkermansiaceae bacterium]
MKKVTSLFVALLVPLSGLFADDKTEAPKKKVADSHEVITKEYFKLGASMGDKITKIKDKATAEAFSKTMTKLSKDLEGILKRLEALPAPSDDQKKAAQEASDKLEAEMTKKMTAWQKSMNENPLPEEDQAALSKAMQDIMLGEDSQKVQKLTKKIEAIYGLNEDEKE